MAGFVCMFRCHRSKLSAYMMVLCSREIRFITSANREANGRDRERWVHGCILQIHFNYVSCRVCSCRRHRFAHLYYRLFGHKTRALKCALHINHWSLNSALDAAAAAAERVDLFAVYAFKRSPPVSFATIETNVLPVAKRPDGIRCSP